MKRIVSVSIGSSTRDHCAQVDILGEAFTIERIGTNGDINKAIQLITELDGKVDAFGMGGIDLYVYGNKGKRYVLKAALPMARAARKTPIVDGSGLKNTLERKVVDYLHDQLNIDLAERKVLLVCAMDRFGMAEAFENYHAAVTYGDFMFVLDLPMPIKSLSGLRTAAALLMPVVSRLPFKMLYPTGQSQEKIIPKYEEFYRNAEIIAGDYLYIQKYMPSDLKGKIIVTNTVTQKNVQDLKDRGADLLVTSTPEIQGRSFGTNVMEAVFVSILGKTVDTITSKDYQDLIDQLPSIHRMLRLNEKGD